MDNMFHTDFIPFIALYKTQLDEFKTAAIPRNRSVARDRLEQMLATMKNKVNHAFELNSQMVRDYKKLVNEFEIQLARLN